MLEADGGTYRILYTSILTELGDIYLSRNQPSKALQITRLVGEMHDRNGRGGTSARTITYQNEATLLQALGETRAALAQRQIVKQRLADLETPGQTAFAYSVNYAKIALRMGRPQEALQAVDEETERVRRSGNALVLANWLEARGAALIQLQRWEEAEKALTEAQSFVSGGLGNKSLGAEIESWQAELDLARGNLEAARHHVDRSLQLAGYHGPKAERSLARVLLVGAKVALIQGAASTGEQFARDALRIAESIERGPDTSADVGEALLRLGQARLALRAPADAHPLLERAIRCLTNGLAPEHPLTLEARALAGTRVRAGPGLSTTSRAGPFPPGRDRTAPGWVATRCRPCAS
jgi:tetratricopeptide (TPR) repeat protein